MSTKGEVRFNSEEFFAAHPVFSLNEAVEGMDLSGGKSATQDRLAHHVRSGRLKRVVREVYAVVPRGADARQFRPDPYLVAASLKPDAVFAYHSALDLLGVGHSSWNRLTVFTASRRPPLKLNGAEIRFLDHPAPFRLPERRRVGTVKAVRGSRLLLATGRERTLVEGFRRLDLVGGLEEFIHSVEVFPAFDLLQLKSILECYSTPKLWAAVGWFLEARRDSLYVRQEYLSVLESRKPLSPKYLDRNSRGGTMLSRWNLILPPEPGSIGLAG